MANTVDVFNGMSDRESVHHQINEWVKGDPLHNTIRDECCPDFSCCNGGKLIGMECRERFKTAFLQNDEKTMFAVMSMTLTGLAADMGVGVHVVGESSEH